MKHHVYRMFVDHYIQAEIISRLIKATHTLRFSELKDNGIDNSLFMYHANKLIRRGIIAKTDEGFSLTQDGARWVNGMDADMVSIKPTPRTLVQLVVINEKNEILLSVRKGKLRQFLNEYLLPGGLHHLGKSADENASSLLKKWFPGRDFEMQFISTIENISQYSDNFVHHSLSQVYEAKVSDVNLPAADERFDFLWVDIADLTPDSTLVKASKFLPIFIEKWQANTLRPREVIAIEV